ncbi:MAG: DUF1329 domain-containing protein [Pseudomonadales bacterium]|nr:DUF1329 domain-containing protein [Pseudomonadales bacterium]
MSSPLNAAVSDEDAKKLQNILTPSGAQKAANADNSIPAWSGENNALSRSVAHISGHAYPNIYRSDKAIIDVHAHNLHRYTQYLTPGLQALFKAYPETFFVPVYPSHREHNFSKHVIQRNEWNAKNTQLSKDGDHLKHYTGGVPFPIPQSAEEVIWNARLNHPNAVLNGILDDIGVYPNGKRHLLRQEFTSEYPFSNPYNEPGMTEARIGDKIALMMVNVIKPERDKGTMTVVLENINSNKHERKAWVYTSQMKRVRRAPVLGADIPYGPGGFATLDDILGFNGSIARYNWKLLGKQEKFIPYHAYEFDRQDLDYFELLMEHHANPEYMRYEKHRVWVVEAELKKGQNHSYSKRRFYIDEDSWQIALLESYDHEGNIWRVGILNTVYDFALKGHVARAQMMHDLKAKAYLSMRMVNENGQPQLQGSPKGSAFYSATNLKKLGK